MSKLDIRYLSKTYTKKQLTKLTELRLDKSQIDEIDASVFENITNLTILSLSYNGLTKIIGNNTFKQLTYLSRLRLNNNQLEKLDAHVFEACSNLSELYLNHNKLTRLNANIFKQLNKLTELSLSNNLLEMIDAKLFENCINLTHLYLDNNKLERIDGHTFKKLTKLNRLELNNNKIKLLDGNSFRNLNEIQHIDLSNNCIVANLTLLFQPRQSLVNLNFSFNFIQSVNFKFLNNLNGKIRINISSNDFQSFMDISISESETNALPSSSSRRFEINARFNSIQTIPFDQLFTDSSSKMKNFKFDLSKNPLVMSCVREIVKNEIYREVFTVQIVKQTDQSHQFIKNIKFDLLKDRYPHIESFKEWKNISEFSVITGKNGVGKSTALSYIKDMIHEFYKNELATENERKITDYNENTSKLKENFFIPVVYKMHDKIKPDTVSIDELKHLADEFLYKLNKRNTDDESVTTMKWEFFQRVINIFAVDSIDKLILEFRSNIDRINQHLDDFKYKIEIINSSSEEEAAAEKVSFVEKQKNSKTISLESANLSPGEQLMLLFRLWEFALTRYEIPHTPVLLLDEPDAHLHPKAVHDFVRILEKLSRSGAQIIMTTHNPSTVSLVQKENLFCMRKTSDGFVCIENAKIKTETIRDLTDDLIVVNEPYRIVLVEGNPSAMNLLEPEYQRNERDAIFYRLIHLILCKNKRATSNLAKFQLVFKSFSGHNDILEFFDRIDKALIYQDHCAIIDNDNFFEISSTNRPGEEMERYYSNRSKRKFNLLRHSLENYILDPVNLLAYLNFYSQKSSTSTIRVSKSKLEKFYERVAKEMSISYEIFLKHFINVSDDYWKDWTRNKLDKNRSLFQAVVNVLGRDLIEYLTQLDGFNYRICKRKKELANLMLIFQYKFSLNKKQTENDDDDSDDFSGFCSISLVKNAQPKILLDKFKADRKLKLLNNSQDEINSKEKELKEFNDTFVADAYKDFEIAKIKSNLKPLSESYQLMVKSKQFREFIRTKKINKRNDLKSCFYEFLELEGKSQINNKNEMRSYIDCKFQLDERLIDYLKEYLSKSVDCCFVEHENQVFKYPRVFFKLRGHFLEEVIFEMFFEASGDYFPSKLINDLLREQGPLNSCGYVVPNELNEIFKRIINIG